MNSSEEAGKIAFAFLDDLALAVCPRHLKAVGDIPVAVFFDNGRELIMHRRHLPILDCTTGRPKDERPLRWRFLRRGRCDLNAIVIT